MRDLFFFFSLFFREANNQVQESRIDQTVGDFFQGLFALPLNLTLGYTEMKDQKVGVGVFSAEEPSTFCVTKVLAVYIYACHDSNKGDNTRVHKYR